MFARTRHLPSRIAPNGAADPVRQVALLLVAYLGYRLIRGEVDGPAGAAIAFEHAGRLVALERGLHVFVEPSVQQWAAGRPGLLDASSWLYLNAQSTVTVGALAYLYLRHNDQFYFVRNMFVVAFGVALVGYVVYPAAPPRFLPQLGFTDAVSDFSGVGQDAGVAHLFNPYAAVPSMHVAFALMVAVPLARLVRHDWVRAFWVVYPALVTFVVVATANHFLIDAVLGACTAAAGALAARSLGRAR